jgi:hypothetical protein
MELFYVTQISLTGVRMFLGGFSAENGMPFWTARLDFAKYYTHPVGVPHQWQVDMMARLAYMHPDHSIVAVYVR